MTHIAIPGSSNWWVPRPRLILGGVGAWVANDALTLDADEEEIQLIASVTIDGGGSKTFGTSSTIGWLPGASITFASGSTLRVGLKDSTKIDTGNGPAARATVGAAAFNVYKDLVGGTDTITSLTWRTDAMASGTPFTVADGDLVALCLHLDTSSGTPSVKMRAALSQDGQPFTFPVTTLVTTGGTVFTAAALLFNAIIVFDDGALGWLAPSQVQSSFDVATSAIGNTNIIGNILNFPWTVQIDALGAVVNPSTNAANYGLCLYSTPLGTPSLIEEIAQDANIGSSAVNNLRGYVRRLTTPRELLANTDYLVGIKQNTATTVTALQYDVSTAVHFKPNGHGAELYAANSTAGATFAAQNSGRRRYSVYARISSIDIPSGGGGGLKLVGTGGLVG